MWETTWGLYFVLAVCRALLLEAEPALGRVAIGLSLILAFERWPQTQQCPFVAILCLWLCGSSCYLLQTKARSSDINHGFLRQWLVQEILHIYRFPTKLKN